MNPQVITITELRVGSTISIKMILWLVMTKCRGKQGHNPWHNFVTVFLTLRRRRRKKPLIGAAMFSSFLPFWGGEGTNDPNYDLAPRLSPSLARLNWCLRRRRRPNGLVFWQLLLLLLHPKLLCRQQKHAILQVHCMIVVSFFCPLLRHSSKGWPQCPFWSKFYPN